MWGGNSAECSGVKLLATPAKLLTRKQKRVWEECNITACSERWQLGAECRRRSCSTFSILHSTCTAINWHQPREYCKQAMTINCKLLPIWVYIYFITTWKWKISPETILESPVTSGTIITLPSHQQPARDVIYHFNLVPGPQRIAQHNTSAVND